ncbi:MAG: LysM peptidoglycan-binding domain-containing protein [Betaproteobacteria bacterium]
MKKSKLTLLFVLSIAGFVPQSGWTQSTPDAKSEVGGKKATVKTADNSPLTLAADAPNTYTVVKGDTLWDISGRFLKEPWRWPEIWNMNRDQIKNPHWIYPGDVINLTYDANGRPILSVNSGGTSGSGYGVSGGNSKLNPQIRVDRQAMAVPSIPSRAIAPFLTLPLVIEEGALLGAPKIIAAEDGRVIIGAGNTAYAVGLNPDAGIKWQIYRPGKTLVDPATKEILGYEAIYLGDSRVSRFGESSTLEIIRSNQEINRGDRLTPTIEATLPSYSPHAPDKQMKGAVVSVVGSVEDAAQYSVVALSLGKRDGLEVGHVLATLQRGEVVSTRDDAASSGTLHGIKSFFTSLGNNEPAAKPESGSIPAEVKLPDERNGLVFIFRVFDKVSYGLVMSSRRSLKVGDVVQTP